MLSLKRDIRQQWAHPIARGWHIKNKSAAHLKISGTQKI